MDASGIRDSGATARTDRMPQPQAHRDRTPSPQNAAPEVASDSIAEKSAIFEAALRLISARNEFGARTSGPVNSPFFPEFGTIGGEACGASDHNCFLYAINIEGDNEHTGFPGQFNALEMSDRQITEGSDSPGQLAATLIEDGFRYVADASELRDGESLIATFFEPKTGDRTSDYHFARLDRDGQWSEKFGDFEPTRLQGSPEDPRNDNYDLVGYFAFDSSELEAKMHANSVIR